MPCERTVLVGRLGKWPGSHAENRIAGRYGNAEKGGRTFGPGLPP